jgi:hypothetical protein
MGKNELVDLDKQDGEKLLKALDSSGIEISAALWLYDADQGEWRFLIASPLVDEKGPLEVYKIIREHLATLNLSDEMGSSNISVVGKNDKLINLLKIAIQTGPKSVSQIRFTRNVINGTLIEDAYIYRIAG